ncbi:unnamed protein product [Lymnaea stagnalis]|uniref:protein-serine/threonine phosphatase n=1 Tax=Lymnaea stagnalis TaxID=6523 RepID=A0AAV2HWP2_LYMST
MGVYLSSPVTEKESVDEQCEGFVYGASSMQGWRITQEDAHNCIPVFDNKTKTSFFAVYDGHGGSEVAKYCEIHFPEFVKRLMGEQNGLGEDPTVFIQNAFLAFDATLTNDDVIRELKELAGKLDDDDEEEEGGEPVGRTETDMLKEEANMPLDQLLAQYKSRAPEDMKILHQQDFKSPALKPKSKLSSEQKSETEPVSSPTFIEEVDESSVLHNGVDDVNNSNSHVHSRMQSDGTLDNESGHDNNNEKLSDSQTAESTKAQEDTKSGTVNNGEVQPSSLQSAGSSTHEPESVAGCSIETNPSCSGSATNNEVRKSKAKAAANMAKLDHDLDTSDDESEGTEEDDEEEEMWEDMSNCIESFKKYPYIFYSDEEDDDEEEDHEEDVPMMDVSNEEPGSDSGCTACVALLQGKRLIVANAGDSRCILARAGKAVELSFDHKPEDDSERKRIEKAGGKVTSDGRVNGGLNLSRAIGDHVYKRNKDLPDKEQMITALPDIETAELCDEDQFIVIACDGIWNYLSSQEVVDYVLDKLKDPEKQKKPSLICEELFDHCLAPNTYGDGTGCDNMTCIIIVLDMFNKNGSRQAESKAAAESPEKVNNETDQSVNNQILKQTETDFTGSLKRCSDNVVNEGKRLKLDVVD